MAPTHHLSTTAAGMVIAGSPAQRWSSKTITYGFALGRPGYTSDAHPSMDTTFSQLAADQMTAVDQVVQLWADVADIKLVKTTLPGTPYTLDADVTFRNYYSEVDNAGGFTVPPGYTHGGDVFLNTAGYYPQLAPGQIDYETILHEVGHALGLSHPGPYNAAENEPSPTYAEDATYIEDSKQYSVMSYFDAAETGGNFGSYQPFTPMMDDIMALQIKYGANMATRTGDTVYGFNSNADRSVFHLTDSYAPAVFCIWDAGGNDTLDFSGYGNDQTINLAAESFSSVGGKASNVSLAYGVTIENAIGGFGRDIVYGNALGNTLSGNWGDDRLWGFGGDDTLWGGDGNDRLFGGTGRNILWGEGDDDTLVAGDLGDTLYGGDGRDTLSGGIGADLLDGGSGADTMSGYTGDDTYRVDSSADKIVEYGNGGHDSVYASANYTLSDQVEDLHLTGWASWGDGNALGNVIDGNFAANRLDGHGGADLMTGYAGDDIFIVDTSSDIVVETPGEGNDLVVSSISWSLGLTDVERLQLTGSAYSATGNHLDNLIYGNDYGNVLNGLVGYDQLFGGNGDDTYRLDDTTRRAGSFVPTFDAVNEEFGAGSDTVYVKASDNNRFVFSAASYALTANVENGVVTGTGTFTLSGNTLGNRLTGNAGVNTLYGREGDDRLDGGAGVDRLEGGAGNDLYILGDVNVVQGQLFRSYDTVVENADGGTDTVYVGAAGTYPFNVANYVLGQNIENGVVTGTAGFMLIGNTLGNRLYGNGAANQLYGGEGNDRLDGGAGVDRLEGGNGNDVYILNDVNDVQGQLFKRYDTVVENAGGGTDTVYVGAAGTYPFNVANYVLGDNVENGVVTGSAGFMLVGNALDNHLNGNDAANQLYGGEGSDTLSGGGGFDRLEGGNGDDVYCLYDANRQPGTGSTYPVFDQVVEAAGGGTDTVYVESAISGGTTVGIYALASSIENAVILGPRTFTVLGNDLDNDLRGGASSDVLYGGGGRDHLVGGAGNDVLRGQAGDDTYVVETAGDVVYESAGGGYDSVATMVGYALRAGQEIESLSVYEVKSTVGADLTGNEFAQSLTGGAGADRLDGNLGNDVLTGGAGRDTFVFDTAPSKSNIDIIRDFSQDVIALDHHVFGALQPGALRSDVFAYATVATSADQHVLYDAKTGALFYDADGSGKAAATQVATLATQPSLAATDFAIT